MRYPLRPIYGYNLPVGASSVNAARVIPRGILALRFAATADCWVTIGQALGADTSRSFLVFAGVPELIGVTEGETISVVRSGELTGSLNVSEMSH